MCDTRVVVERVLPGAILPRKAHESDACFDLYAPAAGSIGAGETGIIDLGLRLELAEGWEAQIRGRSGLAKRGIVVHPGTIDCEYRKNVGVLVHNLSALTFAFAQGDRVAQMKISRVWQVELCEGQVAPTERGGFGSTGR